MPKEEDKQASECWFGMRLTAAEKADIEHLAEQKGTTQKEAVLGAVRHEARGKASENLESRSAFEVRPGSFLDGVEDLIGSVEGPGDLSTNPEHMEGYGED